jgi:hypothetical protein
MLHPAFGLCVRGEDDVCNNVIRAWQDGKLSTLSGHKNTGSIGNLLGRITPPAPPQLLHPPVNQVLPGLYPRLLHRHVDVPVAVLTSPAVQPTCALCRQEVAWVL